MKSSHAKCPSAPRTRLLRVLLAVLSTSLGAAAFAGSPRDEVPQALRFDIFRFVGNSGISLKNGRLTCTSGSVVRASIAPTRAQWKTLRAAFDEAGVWHWQPEYPSSMSDGVEWTLVARYADVRIKSHGINLFPDVDGKPWRDPRNSLLEQSPNFVRLRGAINALLPGCEL